MGLSTLFFTEFWERFSYYGMRAILVLFLIAAAEGENPGMQLSTETANIIYGLYAALIYTVGIPGGWIADRILGAKKSVLYGGIIIAAGHFCMGIPGNQTFFLGMLLIIIGTGLLKPNISVMVGQLYSEKDASRRDSAFSIFYMGINMGAFLSPYVCGSLGENYNWHYGFAAAGVGMLFGLAQYMAGGKHLKNVGEPRLPATDPSVVQAKKVTMAGSAVAAGVVAVLWYCVQQSILSLSEISTGVGVALLMVPLFFFGRVFRDSSLSTVERQRFAAILVFFIFTIIFWAAFEQAGSSLNIFAERYTDKYLFGLEIPASYFQSVNPIYIILFTPVLAWVWTFLAHRAPSTPAKFALGLVLVSFGFFVIAYGATALAVQPSIGPQWLLVMYMFHTLGELCISPVGLSLTTKLAPTKYTSQAMGIWFLSSALAHWVAGLVASKMDMFSLDALFASIGAATALTGILLFVLRKRIIALMNGIK